MKNLTLLIIVVLFATSCMTPKHIRKKYPDFREIYPTEVVQVKVDTVYEPLMVEVRDTFKITVKPDTVTIDSIIRVVDNVANMGKVRRNLKLREVGINVIVEAEVINNRFLVSAYTNDTIAKIYVHDTVYVDSAKVSINTDRTERVEYIPKGYKYGLAIAILLLVFVSSLLVYSLKKV